MVQEKLPGVWPELVWTASFVFLYLNFAFYCIPVSLCPLTFRLCLLEMYNQL